MNTLIIFSIIIFAGLIHASFQLSISVLTLLSGHTIGSKKSHTKLMRMTSSFVFGSIVMTLLLLSFFALFSMKLFGTDAPGLLWSISSGLLFGVAISVWLFYYRKDGGTTLWLPRGIADYLNLRSKHARLSAEAFSLGLVSVIGEILFLVAPMLVSALALLQLPDQLQIIGIIVYAIISSSSLIVVWMLIGGGHNISSIQNWREDNKKFLQFSAGAGLMILGLFVYVNEVIMNVAGIAL